MPKAKISKKDRLRAEHEAFLRSHGIDPNRRPKIKGAPADPLIAKGARRDVREVQPSDLIPGNGTRADLQMRAERGEEDRQTVRAIEALKSMVAQPYNKGPFMLVTDPEVLKQNMRRPGGI